MIPSIRPNMMSQPARQAAVRFGQNENPPAENPPAQNVVPANPPQPTVEVPADAKERVNAMAAVMGFMGVMANPIAAAIVSGATAAEINALPKPKAEPERIKV